MGLICWIWHKKCGCYVLLYSIRSFLVQSVFFLFLRRKFWQHYPYLLWRKRCHLFYSQPSKCNYLVLQCGRFTFQSYRHTDRDDRSYWLLKEESPLFHHFRLRVAIWEYWWGHSVFNLLMAWFRESFCWYLHWRFLLFRRCIRLQPFDPNIRIWLSSIMLKCDCIFIWRQFSSSKESFLWFYVNNFLLIMNCGIHSFWDCIRYL